jgi:hypothetical protein
VRAGLWTVGCLQGRGQCSVEAGVLLQVCCKRRQLILEGCLQSGHRQLLDTAKMLPAMLSCMHLASLTRTPNHLPTPVTPLVLRRLLHLRPLL